MKSFLASSVLGALLLGGMSYLIYDIWLVDFVTQQTNASLRRESVLLIPMIVSYLGQGALLTLLFWRWPEMNSLARGLFAGAAVGFLLGLAFNFDLFAISGMKSLAFTSLEPFLWGIRFAVSGAVVARFVGLKKPKDPA